jgi:hypothetical protein
MAYREVTMIEIKEVLRQWMAGERGKRIARRLGRVVASAPGVSTGWST